MAGCRRIIPRDSLGGRLPRGRYREIRYDTGQIRGDTGDTLDTGRAADTGRYGERGRKGGIRELAQKNRATIHSVSTLEQMPEQMTMMEAIFF